MRKNLKEKLNPFVIILTLSLVIATFLSIILSWKFTIFVLNENQLLYLFSAMAQVIAGVFGLTLTAYVFFADKFRESTSGDDTLYDATVTLLKRYFYILAMLAIVCGTVIALCIFGIIDLYNWMKVYSFIINETVLLFIVGIVAILAFGAILLDPEKLDKALQYNENSIT